MKIAQLTDLHIGRDGEDTFQTDVRGNFQNVLALLRRVDPDYLVISGDLCFRDPDPGICRWVREQLEATELPFDLISGNHDDPVMLAEVFERTALLQQKELYFVRELAGRVLLFLDTTTGEVSKSQLDWLSRQLAARSGDDLIVFMHHPPVYAGVPYMDGNYPLRNREAVQALFFRHDGAVQVFSGHYHVDKVIQRRNLTAYITPSCFFQIDQHREEFAVDHRRPGLRLIHLNGDSLLTTVHYAEALPLRAE